MGRSVLVRMTETGEWLEKVRCGSPSHSKIKGCLRTLGYGGVPRLGSKPDLSSRTGADDSKITASLRAARDRRVR
jgi:hypothetical protein